MAKLESVSRLGMGMKQRRRVASADFTRPLIALAAFVGIILLMGMMLLVDQFDLASQRREEMIVEHGISARVSEIATTVLPQVMWDDAVSNLDNRFNRAWASENIGAYLNKTGGFDDIFLLDPDDHPIYAASAGADGPTDRYRQFSPSIESLLARARKGEAIRGPLPEKPEPNGVLAKAIQESAIVEVDGLAYIAVATIVTPDFGRARPRGKRAPIVLAIMEIDQAFLDQIANRFLLDGIHLHPGNSRFEQDEAHAAIFDGHGQYVATLDWLPQRPGHDLLRRVGPSIAAIGALLLGMLVIFYHRSRNMAEGLIASEARATHIALHDSLTGLPNRALFLNRLEMGLARLRRSPGSLAVHCVDLDRFKEINDTLGHLVGDELIRAAADRMAASCRASEMFARLSGDEFAIVQTDSRPDDAAALAERLCEIMSEPFQLSTGKVFVGCSVGIAMTDNPDIDPAELFRQADLALYRAKSIARGNFCLFEPDMDAAIKSRRVIEADLREALRNDELYMAYQPQVDARGMMVGVEALIRWSHPRQGDISPAFFVPIAEQSGLIAALGRFTMQRAFEDSHRWPGLRIGINVSAIQLRMKDFVATLSRLAQETRVDPRNFELEITEGVLLLDDPETHETLRALRHMGFGLALDDFGTGYSSLSYLRRYPIDRIKIDRSFISNLGMGDESDEVVGAIVKLARALHLSVIAEGVETVEQRDWLHAAGCHDSQGYLFSKPLMASEIDALRKTPHQVLTRRICGTVRDGRGSRSPLSQTLVERAAQS